jgi:ribosomal protein L7/L12
MSSSLDDTDLFESEDTCYNLLLVETGEYYFKVFSLVRQITGLSPKEVKSILDYPPSVITSGYYTEMIYLCNSFHKIGAKTKLTIIED